MVWKVVQNNLYWILLLVGLVITIAWVDLRRVKKREARRRELLEPGVGNRASSGTAQWSIELLRAL